MESDRQPVVDVAEQTHGFAGDVGGMPCDRAMGRALLAPVAVVLVLDRAAAFRATADDRLPLDPYGGGEGGDGVVEGCHVADVRPQPTVPDPLDDLTELPAIGLDDKVDPQAIGGSRLGRADDGHQSPS